MSTANIPAFHDKVAQSPELQTRLAEIQQQAARTTAEAIARLATEVGTPFTAEDLLTTQHEDQELSEAELADVAGGKPAPSPIVKKEALADGLSNLWGLWGKDYGYTTESGLKYVRKQDLKIGDLLN